MFGLCITLIPRTVNPLDEFLPLMLLLLDGHFRFCVIV
nr:MAG TPA: hypothetical protein [Caudoviricetes sp.]